MKNIVFLLVAVLLSSCAHHLVGSEMKPFHSLENTGHEVVKGSWVSVNYEYRLNGNAIDFDGVLSFDREENFQEWSHVKVVLTFIFTDSGNIVRSVKTKNVNVGGGYLGEETFHCSFPYEENYKSMRIHVNLTGYH